MSEPLVQVTDRAVPAALLRRVREAVEAIGSRASYWRTFWYPLDREPACLPEQVGQRLAPLVPERERIVGVEWWLGRMDTANVPLDFHHDRDLALFERTGRVSTPAWSSVLYLNAVTGGSLLVTDQRLMRRGQEYRLVPEEAGAFATVHPAPNRFARFRGHCLHGVLDLNDEVPRPANRKRPGGEWRLSLVVNWWTRKPLGVRRWSVRAGYPELALPSANLR